MKFYTNIIILNLHTIFTIIGKLAHVGLYQMYIPYKDNNRAYININTHIYIYTHTIFHDRIQNTALAFTVYDWLILGDAWKACAAKYFHIVFIEIISSNVNYDTLRKIINLH